MRHTEIVDEQDMSKPIIRRKKLSAVSRPGYQTTVEFGEYGTLLFDESAAGGGEGAGPSPLHVVVGALCACERVTFERTSKDLGFEYQRLEFEAEFTIDVRGRMGVREVRPHFQTVRLQARVVTEETAETLAEVVRETEARCPVYNLLSDAGVKLETLWIRAGMGDAAKAPSA